MNPTRTCPKCAAPLPADAPQGHCPQCLTPGAIFGHGRYTLFQLLGMGRMGMLWKARDERMDEFVALRFLPLELRSDPGAMEGLRLEAERARRLTHPNIVRTHELHELPDEPTFLALEHVKGESLAELRLKQPQQIFSWEDLEPLARQWCAALACAHSEGVIHGNLKPTNLIVDKEGRLKVTDFGFACLSGVNAPGADSETLGGELLPYWSPQQLDGRLAELPDDLYAFGVTLYELLSGRPPFYLGDIASQARHVLPKPLAERLADFALENEVPPYISAMIMACLAKEPAERPPNVAAVVESFVPSVSNDVLQPPADFTDAKEELVPAEAAPVPSSVSSTATKPRGRFVAAWAGAAVGVMALGLAAYWYSGFNSGSQAVVAGALLVFGEAKPTGLKDSPRTNTAALPVAFATKVQRTNTVAPPVAFASATKTQPFLNSLGMKFVPVPNTGGPTDGQPVLFSVWHTRLQDFEAFVKATGHGATEGVWSFGSDGWRQRGQTWQNPGFDQTGLHPVSGVSWEDAQAFAKWLTGKERAEGKLAANQRYRLPQDWEWSVAVALNEARMGTPNDKDQKIKGVFPWGTQWPPPSGAGNYGNSIAGVRDGFERTSPVESFAANQFGLYDMGGNLWQWCEDWHDSKQVERPLRGGSWGNDSAETLWSSYRHHIPPNRRYTSNGFRVVLATEPTANTNPALAGYEIVGFYGATNDGGTILRTSEKAPVKQGDRIRVTGMGIYDGEWTVLQAFPYKSPFDTKPLWGYRIEAKPKAVPGFTPQGGVPNPNPARLQPLSATTPSQAAAKLPNFVPKVIAPTVSIRPPGPPIRFEAEQLQIVEQVDCNARPQAMTAWGANRWSGGSQLFCASGARGTVTLNLPVGLAGRYRLNLQTTTAPDFGTYQVSLDGTGLSTTLDAWSREVRPANRISLGPVQLTAGSHRLQFRIMGKNPASTGYCLGLDYVDLVVVAQ